MSRNIYALTVGIDNYCHARSRGISPIASVWDMVRKRPEPNQKTVKIEGKLDLST